MLPQAIQTYGPCYTHSLGRLKFLLALSYTIALLLPTCFTFSDVTLTGVVHAALLSDAPTATLTTAPKSRATALQSPMQVEPEPTTLLFSSFLGGSGHETVTGMRFDTDNNAYRTGQTGSTDFPLLSPLNNTTLTGEPQTFVVQVGAPIDIAATLIPSDSHLHLGEDQTWRVEWENNGPDPATDVQVVFEFEEPGFPSSLQFKSLQNISGPSNIDISSCSGSALSGPGGTLACAVSDIPFTGGQSSAALTFTPVTAEGYSLSVEMVGPGEDINPSNNGNSFTGEIGNESVLTVNFQGSGTGRVEAMPGPSSPLATIFDDVDLSYSTGTTVSLAATPLGFGGNASVFNGWTGCDSVNQAGTCTVTVNASRTISPSFDLANLAVTVPNVVGQTQAAATAGLTSANLTVGTVTTQASTSVPTGSVISQNPVAGTNVTPSSAVALVISSGVATVAVPNVVGQTQAAATAAINGVTGLSVGAVTQATSATVATGNVINQNPTPGLVPFGSTVALVVSSGPVLLRTLTVTTNPAAGGTVTGTGINCGSDCTETVNNGTVMTLTAAPASGFTFTSWTGCDTTAGAQCTVTLTSNRTVTATFTVNPVLRTLTVTTNPATGGTVTGTGINCGSDCSQTVDEGTVMTLTAAPVSGFTFTSWTGCDATPGALCIVTLTSNRTVTATFNLNNVTLPNVVGQTQAAATAAINGVNGLSVGTVTQASSATVASGIVISQNPGPSQVPSGRTVALVVSTGP